MRWTLLFGALAISLATGQASAGCNASPDDPMAWDDGYGVSSCGKHGARYHANDFAGEAAQGYAESSDPMVWSDDQWRSTLFDGYSTGSNSNYDRRSRRGAEATPVAAIKREAQVIVRQDSEATAEPVEHRGWRLVTRGAAADVKTPNGVLRFDGHHCSGVLILTWGKLGGKQRCYEGGERRLKVR